MLLFFVVNVRAQQKDDYLILGTYTNAGSHGIYVAKFDKRSGGLTMVDSVKASNPSFLTVSPDKNYVYAVNENANAATPNGSVSSYHFNKKIGKLLFLNQQKTKGNHPCYISIDKTGQWLFVGNYSSGNLSVLPVSANLGIIDTATTTIQHVGSSINKERQNAPHVHQTVLSKNNKWLLVPDLGTDQLMLYQFNKNKRTLTPSATPFVKSIAGSGPRHISFGVSEKYVYLLEELTGTIAAYQFSPNDGSLKLIQQISTVPDDFKGFAGSADIHVSPDGKFLYASNRGESNSIATFSINRKSGELTKVSVDSVLGLTPRNFSIHPSGKYLLVANQNSNEVVVFARSMQTGLLTDTGNRLALSRPVCLQWILP